ncbi:MAG: endonuclease/exonuclease/phosphatase family protein [Desulfobacteraceae bacterium]|nr:endonuclease/exonuclease/phosphatase family protein [Desulfobacteraceae bacterium]
MKKIFKIILGLISIILLGFVGLVGYATLSDYKPAPTSLVFENQEAKKIAGQKQFNLMIWNIGYAGLSKDMDFFYDGGKQVRTDIKNVENNIAAIENFIEQQKDIDFFLFQEVDKNSKRSYFINEYSKISEIFPQFYSGFGKNYDVFFVPVPPANPLGSVLAGLQTLSRFEPASIVRHSFPGNYAWPQGLFMLDRCFLVSRYLLADTKKELVMINTHNSAYDDGTLRSIQMLYLKSFLNGEYEKGNYVIVGGDWNQCPPGFKPDFSDNLMDNKNRMDIKGDYLSEWNWAYDSKIPTNRRLVVPYDKNTTLTTVIDFFLLSPNIEMVKVLGIDLGFEHSDHHPVKLKIKLN